MESQGETIIIQPLKEQNMRVKAQFEDRALNTALYLGKGSAERWKEWHTLHPMKDTPSIPIDEKVTQEFDLVDLGPGSGEPCIAALAELRDRVRRVVCVDTSLEMANMAAVEIENATRISVTRVVADFLRDTKDIQEQVLSDREHSQVLLCLGGTVGNYRQSFILPALRKLLQRDHDRLILGMGYLSEENPQQQLADLGMKFCSRENCSFALACLEEYGHKPEWSSTYYSVSDDGEDPGIKIVHGCYRFGADTEFVIENDQEKDERLKVAFAADDDLEFTQSRRYPKEMIPRLLEKYRLKLLRVSDLGTHGLHLCQRMNGNG